MRELVVARQSQFHSNSKCLDRHDRDRSNSRANRQVNQGVPFPVLWRDSVYHNDSKYNDREAEYEEPLHKSQWDDPNVL